ncbi:MAG: heme o synthase [Thermoplasmatota archaeon]
MDTERRIQLLRRLSVVVVIMTYGLMVLGSWVKATGSGLACPDWPQCYGEWLPPFPSADTNSYYEGQRVVYTHAQVMYEWGHRFVAALLGPVFLAFAWIAFRGKELAPALRRLPAVAGFVLVGQIFIGGLTVVTGNPAWATTWHLATATLFFFLVTWSAAVVWLRPLAPMTTEAQSDRPFSAVVKDYVEISKPRIILLLLVVAWAAMFVAEKGLPRLDQFLAVTLAGTFSTAASGAFNNVWEKERDRRMGRTAQRAVAAGRIPVSHALIYAGVLSVLSILGFAVLDKWLAALLTFGAIGYYVIVYTALLKPTTAQSIVIGGFAGSFPALIGWAAVTDTVGLPAWILAGLVFLWTPAHFWALALLYKHDYAAAEYPMLPNTQGEAATRRQVRIYSALTVLCSIVLVYPLAEAGLIYLIAALGLGFLLVRRASDLEAHPTPKRYRSFFLFTIQYLGLLFVALMVDQLAFLPILG